jgi:ribonuclease D
VIDTDQKLAAFLPALCTASWVALDTEADSLHAYPEKLCLIQVGIEGRDELVDPLARTDLKPLWEAVRPRELIVHGADYDLRLLRKCSDFVPSAIFDTMLAARLIGCRRFGLTDLVARYLAVTLEKGPQKANWARRPLTPRMASYARDDVHYLKPLADLLRFQLTEKGRLSWHQQSCARLIADATEIRDPDPDAVWRVKGSSKLAPPRLAILREVWHWREAEAMAANKPPFFVLTPAVMVQLAAAAVEDAGRVSDLVPRHFSARRRHGLLQAVTHGRAAKNLPEVLRPKGRRQTDAERKRLHELTRRRNQHATQLGMDPTLIASRADLAMLARDWSSYEKDLMDWQRALLRAAS